MNLLHNLMARWMVVLACTLLGAGAAATVSLVEPRSSSATVRTYVASGTADMLEAYQGGQAALAGVRTYEVLATDPTVAARAIKESGVDIALSDLLAGVSVSVPAQTVILDITVTDESADDARALALALARNLVGLVDKLEGPVSGGPGALRLVIVDPNTRGAVLDRPIDPVLVAAGAGAGALAGAIAALVLAARARRTGDDPTETADPTETSDPAETAAPAETADPAANPDLAEAAAPAENAERAADDESGAEDIQAAGPAATD